MAKQNNLKILVSILCLLTVIIFTSEFANATPDFADKTGNSCTYCHKGGYGGELTDEGRKFAKTLEVEEGFRDLSEKKKPVRFLVGLIHIIAAFLWFGTILYVHIILKPAYAKRGLPKAEMKLGIICMILVGVSGILLTISRVTSLSVLFNTQWGLVLLVKMGVYTVMVSSAIFVVLYLSKKLRISKETKVDIPSDGVYCPLILSHFNGMDGMPCYFAYEDKVYDASESRFWKNGKHMSHPAGIDLTKFLSKAPHGIEQVQAMKVVGTYDAHKEPPKNIYQKIFYFIAYMNLTLVFVVIIAIAFWRWSI